MSNIDLKISLDPIGSDRFVIIITNKGPMKKTISGPDPLGFTESDLRNVNGLPKCGLNEEQINKAILLANSKRSTL